MTATQAAAKARVGYVTCVLHGNKSDIVESFLQYGDSVTAIFQENILAECERLREENRQLRESLRATLQEKGHIK